MEKFTILKNESFNVGPTQRQKIVIKHKKNTPMNPKEIKTLVRMLEKKYIDKKHKEPKIIVRAYDELGLFCLKSSTDSIDDMFEDFEDYLKGRVKDDTKYKQFTQIEINMSS